jgi:hypothetical protein
LEFQRLAGYVVCGECKGSNFEGHLSGAVFSYEYVRWRYTNVRPCLLLATR